MFGLWGGWIDGLMDDWIDGAVRAESKVVESSDFQSLLESGDWIVGLVDSGMDGGTEAGCTALALSLHGAGEVEG
jgi:hypothetical protein